MQITFTVLVWDCVCAREVRRQLGEFSEENGKSERACAQRATVGFSCSPLRGRGGGAVCRQWGGFEWGMRARRRAWAAARSGVWGGGSAGSGAGCGRGAGVRAHHAVHDHAHLPLQLHPALRPDWRPSRMSTRTETRDEIAFARAPDTPPSFSSNIIDRRRLCPLLEAPRPLPRSETPPPSPASISRCAGTRRPRARSVEPQGDRTCLAEPYSL